MSAPVSLQRRPASFTGRDLDAVELEHAQELWRHVRIRHGFAPGYAPPLTQSGEGNAKLRKNGATPTVGLTIAPHRLAGVNVCTASTPGCRELCLFTAGRGGFSDVARARIARAVMLSEYPLEARALIRSELVRTLRKYGRRHVAFRPNVTSDLPWHREPWLAELPARLVRYGYSKHRSYLADDPAGFDLTFSVSERERSFADALPVLEGGHRIAVVVPVGEVLPASVAGWPVIDGDASDARWRDPVGVVTLRAKGKAKHQRPSVAGFVKPFGEWLAA